jgi:alkylated DNA repair dioxygenase AlkB
VPISERCDRWGPQPTRLPDGNLLTIAGKTQKTFKHEVPKESLTNAAVA